MQNYKINLFKKYIGKKKYNYLTFDKRKEHESSH